MRKMTLNIMDEFQKLLPPTNVDGQGSVFSATPIAGRSRWHLGMCQHGRPTILIEASNSHADSSHIPFSQKLQHIHIEHGVRCHLTTDLGDVVDGNFSILHCLSDDTDIQDCFFRSITGSLDSLPEPASASDVTDMINELVRLFQLMQKPNNREVRGLWSELLIIAESENPIDMIHAWHNNATERFDFSRGDQRIEVKSSSTGSRNHIFSFNQVYPPSEVNVLIASVFVFEQTNGTSLGDLWDEVLNIANTPELKSMIDCVCLDYLGENAISSRDFMTFDRHTATESLSYFDIDDIPKIPMNLPTGVSDVKFRSDLTNCGPVDNQLASTWLQPLGVIC
jgi:hypothetical protein